MPKFSIKDLKRSLEYMESKVGAVDANIEFDDRERLKIKGTDPSGNHVEITIYVSETKKMPDITETRRL